MIETYTPASGDSSAISDLESAADDLRNQGVPIRYLRSIVIPEDETSFHVFDAPSAALVSDVGRRAGIPFERIVLVSEIRGHHF